MPALEPHSRASGQWRYRLLWLAAGAVAAFSAGSEANAQSTLGNQGLGGLGSLGAPPVMEGGRHIGVTLSATANYDSNVVGGSDVAATVKGLQQADITYSPRASITGDLPIGIGSVYVTGNIGYLFHQDNPSLNSPQTSVQFGLSGPIKLGPCALNLILGYSASPSDQSQLLLQTLKNIQTQAQFGGSATCSSGGSFGESFSAVHSISDNSAKAGTTNSNTTSYSAGVRYESKLIGSLMLTGSYSTTGYDVPSASQATPQQLAIAQGFDAYAISLGLTRSLSQRLSGTASIGYSLNKPIGVQSGQSSNTINGSGALNYIVNPRTSASLTYSRGAVASLQLGSSYSLQDNLAFTVSYRASTRLTGTLGYVIYRREEQVTDAALFAATANSPFVGATRENGSSETASASLRVGRNGQLSLNLGRTERNTNLTVYNYTDYTVGLSLSERF